jgi:dTDP-glucose 4,6-dehydratase
MNRKTCLVTGIGGFVASHTLRHIMMNTDWDVVGTDSFMHRGKTDRITDAMNGQDASRLTVITHDLKVPFSRQMVEKLKNVDYVISMASESHVDRSITDPRDFIENNVKLILTLMEWVKYRNYDQKDNPNVKPIEKFIQISTDEVYGPIVEGGHKEGSPHRPSNPYSASKAAQEDICYSYWRTYNLPIMITNTMNIIGSSQDVEKFVPKIIKSIYDGNTITIHADDNNNPGTRFYLHARNQADALLFLLKNHQPGMYPNDDLDRFNIVGDKEINNLELAQMVAGFMGKELNYVFENFHKTRPGHDRRYGLDGSKIAKMGWTAPVEFDKSLDDTVKWFISNPDWLIEG